MFGHIKIDPADRVFSEFIRLRDKQCVRCGRRGTGPKGIIGLQASHYFGRANRSTRFDSENCDALCMGCHQMWGSTDREGYRAFKVKQLGEWGFQRLIVRSNLIQKKDKKMELIVAKELLKSLNK